MKSRLVLALAAALVAAPFAADEARAQDTKAAPRPAGDQKLGVVDLGAVIESYKKAAELQAALRAEDDKLKKELDDLRKQISDISRQLEMLDSSSEAFQIREEERKVAVAKWEYREEKRKILKRQRFEKANLELIDDIEAVVRAYGEENKFTLILKVEGKATDEMRLLTAGLKSVFYFSKEIDITPEIVRLLNRNYDLAGGSKQPQSIPVDSRPAGGGTGAPPTPPPAPPPAKAPGK